MIDLTGQTFGRWTVLREVPHAPRAKRRWVCRCSCGIEAEVRIDHLRAGTSVSCGRRHLEGLRVGALLVLRPAANIPSQSPYHVKGHTAWTCHCDSCGREVVIATEVLSRSTTTDCGCSRLTEPAPDVPLKTTSSAEVLREHHDTFSPLGRVRRVFRSVQDEDEQMHIADFDPFD
jgi:hypothetical protein